MNKDIQSLIEREATKYVESIAPSDPSFDLSQLQSEYDAFYRGANFALSLIKWRKVELHTLANNDMLRYTLANYLGVNPNKSKKDLCKLFAKSGGQLFVKNIFEEWDSYPNERYLFKEKRSLDIGLSHIRLLLKCHVKFIFYKSKPIQCDMQILKKISPPLYDKVIEWTR